ncbi:MAG: hypothetical protein COC03_01665 [Robiginitomaculum sp.]|nr:MAG: hypothetical protein COC03_01665 [Robiginitomaculum sp.]PHQ68390.1 MAG: hypothetical protein COB92_00185 [Robiginitomaculum sp.]
MIAGQNLYPYYFTDMSPKRSAYEIAMAKFFLGFIKKHYPEYVKEKFELYNATHFMVDKVGLYGRTIWQLPDHRIYWDRLISFEYVGNRVFELSFQPKNLNSENRKDRISKARLTVFKIEEIKFFTKLLLEEGIENIGCADATA